MHFSIDKCINKNKKNQCTVLMKAHCLQCFSSILHGETVRSPKLNFPKDKKAFIYLSSHEFGFFGLCSGKEQAFIYYACLFIQMCHKD
jgi:hypothetical protein